MAIPITSKIQHPSELDRSGEDLAPAAGGRGPDAGSFCRSLAQEIERSAVLIGVTTSAINALRRDPSMKIPRHLSAHMPQGPVVYPAAAIADQAIEKSTLVILHTLYTVLEYAKSLLNSMVQRSEQGESTNRGELDVVANVWCKTCSAALDALCEIERVFELGRESTEQLRGEALVRMLSAARDGGFPCLEDGRTVVPRWAQQRQHRRFLVNESATAFIRGQGRQILVTDVSQGGLGLDGIANLANGQILAIQLLSGRRLVGRAAWNRGTRVGIKFLKDLPEGDPLISAG